MFFIEILLFVCTQSSTIRSLGSERYFEFSSQTCHSLVTFSLFHISSFKLMLLQGFLSIAEAWNTQRLPGNSILQSLTKDVRHRLIFLSGTVGYLGGPTCADTPSISACRCQCMSMSDFCPGTRCRWKGSLMCKQSPRM